MSSSPKVSERLVGFEIEFSNVPLKNVCDIIVDLYGGSVDFEHSAEALIRKTRFGEFRVELDAEPVKKLSAYLGEESKASESLAKLSNAVSGSAEDLVKELAPKVVPTEVVAPPIPESKIPELDALRAALCEHGAKGTKASVRNAFGLHINPEVKDPEPRKLLAVIKSFSLLYPWLLKAHSVDMARRVAPFIKPFSPEYIEHILSYTEDEGLEKLIKDYHKFNPTRNRALDMLPMFKHMDADLILELYGADEKINARPTFHYRLPNSEAADEKWSLMQEWAIWQTIETSADAPECLKQLEKVWREQEEKTLGFLSSDSHINKISAILEEYDVHKAA